MGLWNSFKKFNHDIFFTEKGNEPAIAFRYDKDGKGNSDFGFYFWGSWIKEQIRVDTKNEKEKLPLFDKVKVIEADNDGIIPRLTKRKG
jgi:hypothetical protein